MSESAGASSVGALSIAGVLLPPHPTASRSIQIRIPPRYHSTATCRAPVHASFTRLAYHEVVVTEDVDSQFFQTHGWLIVRGVVPRTEIAELEAAIDGAIPPPAYPAWGAQVIEAAGISNASVAIARHAHDPRVARIAAMLLGATRVRMLQDTALIKPANSPATIEWHQDYSYLAYLDLPRVVTARIAITPCVVASGCMRVIDGSHLWGLRGDDLTFQRASVENTLGALPPELQARAHTDEQLIELAPGDVSFHSCLTFHRSLENTTSNARKTLVVRMMDAECRLVPERLPSPELRAIFTTDDDGRLTGAAFPTLWEAG